MNTMYLISFFIIGTIFGSFFGVVGTRLCEEKSIIKPRSHCDKCGHILKWYELIPIISYIFQKGKCTNCKCSLSAFYPIIEIISGFLFAISYYLFGFSVELIFSLLIVSFLVIVIVSDINYYIIPDQITLFFSINALFLKFAFYGLKEGLFSLLSGILLFCLMYCIMIIGNKIYKKETLGGADIKLMFFVGAMLTPTLAIFDIFVASLLALPVSVIFLIKDKNNVIPFGPFILMGMFLIFCFS